jgi:hemerythrin
MQESMVWTPEMSLGVPSMDRAHRDFVEQVARLAEVSDKDFPHAYADLIRAVERDFYAEEQLMEEVNFPANNSHVEQHARVLSALHHANSQVMTGDFAAGRKVAELMLQWFAFHLSTMDTALAIAYELASASKESMAA